MAGTIQIQGMNFLVNKHVHAEPKKTNKKQLEKAMGCKQIPKKINSENPLMSTVKLIHVNLKKNILTDNLFTKSIIRQHCNKIQ